MTALGLMDPTKLAQLGVNCLAVGGAFLLGRWGTAGLLWFVNRSLLRGKLPAGPRKVASLVGGVLLALLAALVLFGHGSGWTLMGGSSPGADNGGAPPAPSTGKGAGDVEAPVRPAPPPTAPAPATPLPPSVERVRVLLLGGDDVKAERFYLVNDDATPKTFGETRTLLLAMREGSTRPVGLEVRFNANNRLPADHPAAVLLTKWAQEHGFAVTFPPEGA